MRRKNRINSLRKILQRYSLQKRKKKEGESSSEETEGRSPAEEAEKKNRKKKQFRRRKLQRRGELVFRSFDGFFEALQRLSVGERNSVEKRHRKNSRPFRKRNSHLPLHHL